MAQDSRRSHKLCYTAKTSGMGLQCYCKCSLPRRRIWSHNKCACRPSQPLGLVDKGNPKSRLRNSAHGHKDNGVEWTAERLEIQVKVPDEGRKVSGPMQTTAHLSGRDRGNVWHLFGHCWSVWPIGRRLRVLLHHLGRQSQDILSFLCAFPPRGRKARLQLGGLVGDLQKSSEHTTRWMQQACPGRRVWRASSNAQESRLLVGRLVQQETCWVTNGQPNMDSRPTSLESDRPMGNPFAPLHEPPVQCFILQASRPRHCDEIWLYEWLYEWR